MPFLTRDGARLWWRSDGDAAKPALLLGNSLGTDMTLWDPILPQLVERFHVIRFDMRGHGASDAPPGDYTIEALGRDALAVADAAGVARFSFAGISIGGMIGQWLGANALERVDKLDAFEHVVEASGRYLGRAHRRGEQGRHCVDRGRRSGALVHRGLPARRNRRGCRARAPRSSTTDSRGLHRLLRGDPRHGPDRLRGRHPRADTGHRRHARSRRAEGARRGARQSDPRRAARRASGRAHPGSRSAGRIRERTARLPDQPADHDRARALRRGARAPQGGAGPRLRRVPAEKRKCRSTRSSSR